MRAMIENSLIYRLITAIGAWIDRQWQKSRLCRLVIGPDTLKKPAPGLFGTLAGRVGDVYVRLFEKLGLRKITESSVFLHTELFLLLTVLAAPLLPTMAVLALALATAFSVLIRVGRGEMRLESSPLNKWVYIYAFLTAASTLMSVTLRESLPGGALYVFFAFFSVAVVTVCAGRRELIERMLKAIVFSGAAVAVIGIMQYALGGTSKSGWVDSELYTDISLRVVSTLGNPNVLSEFLLLSTPLAAAAVINAKSFNGRVWAGMAFAAMCACLVFTWSRGGWLGLVLGMAVFLVALDARFVLVGVAGLAAIVVLLPGSMLNRLSNIGDRTDASTNYRYYIYMSAFDMIKDYWLSGFGTGVPAYEAAYAQYGYAAVAAPHAHNLILQILCESGIFTLLALLGSLLTAFRGAAYTAARSKERRARVWSAAILGSGTGYMLQSMTDYSFYNYRVTLVFWILVGLAVSLRLSVEKEEDTL